jgi:hypothetical protein
VLDYNLLYYLINTFVFVTEKEDNEMPRMSEQRQSRAERITSNSGPRWGEWTCESGPSK